MIEQSKVWSSTEAAINWLTDLISYWKSIHMHQTHKHQSFRPNSRQSGTYNNENADDEQFLPFHLFILLNNAINKSVAQNENKIQRTHLAIS